MKKRRQKRFQKFTIKMQKKLVVLFIFVLLAFIALSWRLVQIYKSKGNDYKKQVLSQQQTDSKVLPFRRGDIVDRKGSKLAYSEKVYNLVIDAKLMNSDDGVHLAVTLDSLQKYFPEVDVQAIRKYVSDNPASRYKIFAKKLPYDEVEPFEELMKTGVSVNSASKDKDDDKKGAGKLAGVWFEEDYQRRYPYNSLACDVIGFVQGNNAGFFGLEEYYNSTLNGVDGRQYGYMNEDAVMESSIRPAQDGNTIVTTLDTNIQSIIEKHIAKFMQAHKDEYREGPAADNIGVIVMNPNNGEIYGMAGYPVFDLNNPRNMDGIDLQYYMPASVSANAAADDQAENTAENTAENAAENVTAEVSENSAEVKPEDTPEMKAMNNIWRNFCVSDSYEPGSVMKPFTIASALDSGKITGNETYQCNGYLTVGGFDIHCHNRLGDGLLTIKQGIAKSCNVVLMDVAFAMGKEEWLRYNKVFNFGLKTNIDLAGEANASELTFNENMGLTDLAVASFGQGFNVTMIQMAAGFSALVNGGYYYQPHMVSQIMNAEGAVVEEKSPRVLKQVISEETSAKMRDYLSAVVMSEPGECTGWSARPAGYTEGGKTGTAEKYPRAKKNYLISFMGYVPADDPQVLCYVVIDRPNTPNQSESTRLATVLNKDIMTEVLPYLNIFPTEPLTEEEQQALAEATGDFSIGSNLVSGNELPEGSEGEGAEAGLNDDGTIVIPTEEEVKFDSAGNPISVNEIKYDPETGYPLDPVTGEVLDPVTHQPVNGASSDLPDY